MEAKGIHMNKTALKDVARTQTKARLQTPSDLDTKKSTAVAEALNPLVADAFVLYFKTKNFHWHVSGPHFRDYHKLLDEQADQIFASIDPLAERVRKLGHKTLLGLQHALDLTGIEENLEEYVAPSEMLSVLLEDNKAMAKAMREAHSVCDDSEDVASASLLEIYIDEAERRIWFLFEASRGLDGEGH